MSQAAGKPGRGGLEGGRLKGAVEEREEQNKVLDNASTAMEGDSETSEGSSEQVRLCPGAWGCC